MGFTKINEFRILTLDLVRMLQISTLKLYFGFHLEIGIHFFV